MTPRARLPRAAIGEVTSAIGKLEAAKKKLEPLMDHESTAIMTRATLATNAINEAIIALQKAQNQSLTLAARGSPDMPSPGDPKGSADDADGRR